MPLLILALIICLLLLLGCAIHAHICLNKQTIEYLHYYRNKAMGSTGTLIVAILMIIAGLVGVLAII